VIPDGNEYQTQHIKTYGGMGEFALGFGGDVNDRVYFGATIGFPNIRYEEHSVYEEQDTDNEISVADSLNFKWFRYDRSLLTLGNGINGKFSERNGKLVFDSLQFAKEVCKDKGFEKKLLKGFKSGVIYNILNDKLYMNIDAGTLYIFRRIRR
jgi:hypothetical protein